MSGFKYVDDIISILRQNHLLESEAIGWIVRQHTIPESVALVSELQKRKIPVTFRDEKVVFNYDFVVLDKAHYDIGWLLTALTRTGTSGIIIIEATDRNYTVKELHSYSYFTEGLVSSVKFEDRQYFVLKKGTDYAD